MPDTGGPDTGMPDTGGPDTGMPDTGMPDTGSQRMQEKSVETWQFLRESAAKVGVVAQGLLAIQSRIYDNS